VLHHLLSIHEVEAVLSGREPGGRFGDSYRAYMDKELEVYTNAAGELLIRPWLASASCAFPKLLDR
jgi:hypothetical protein